MIPIAFLHEWSAHAPWPALNQVEQDLIICRALCDLFSNERLRGKIAFRGGTSMHKLLFAKPLRYPEDIDLVQPGLFSSERWAVVSRRHERVPGGRSTLLVYSRRTVPYPHPVFRVVRASSGPEVSDGRTPSDVLSNPLEELLTGPTAAETHHDPATTDHHRCRHFDQHRHVAG